MTLRDLSSLTMPTLCMYGGKTTQASRTVSRILIDGAGFEEILIPNAGHLGPVTHAELVNPYIDTFLDGKGDFRGRSWVRQPAPQRINTIATAYTRV